MLKEFKEFAMKGNVLDMAIGVIIGVAFGRIVTSVINDVLMPPIGLLMGRVDFSNLFINLSSTPVKSVAEAKSGGVPTINYGMFLNSVFDFVIVAFVIFLLIRQVNRLKRQPAPVAPDLTTRECPFCLSTISKKASRCAHCTSQIPSS